MALLDEQIDGKYEILRKIREGGMGAIYKVRHRLLDEIRVVKVIRSQGEPSSESSDRFLREAKAAIKLRHPNIAVLHDFAVAGDGQAFIVMEFIEGWNLQEVMAGYGPPPLGLTLEIARQSLKALGYLHRHKIVHRDVSPDNLMVTRDVEGHLLVKLIDLGIAKNLEGAGGLTTTGVFLGKPRYGSPERFTGEGWDERSDLYSFGVVLYELLTGRPPIVGNDSASQMAGHLFRPPVPFEETDLAGRVPPELREVVLWALAKKPEDRFANAEMFVSALGQVQARCPLEPADVDTVWAVLQPIAARPAESANPAGSTQYRLDQEFGALQTPTRAVLGPTPVRVDSAAPEASQVAVTQLLPGTDARMGRGGESTRRTVPPVPEPAAAPAVVVPFPAATPAEDMPLLPGPGSVAPDDLDATWARRPLRSGPEPKVKGGATARIVLPAPPAAPKAAVAGAKGRWVKGLGALAVATLLGVGGWFAWQRIPALRSALEPAGGTVDVAPSPSPAEGDGAASDVAAAKAQPAPAGRPEGAGRKGKGVASPSRKGAAGNPAEAARDSWGTSRRSRRLAENPNRCAGAAAREPVGPFEVPTMKPGILILPHLPGVQAPEPRYVPDVSYPQAAKGTGKRVSIRVNLLVDEKGRVIDTKIQRPDNSGLGFNEASEVAARRSSFLPATRDGIAGKMWTELYFTFEEPH